MEHNNTIVLKPSANQDHKDSFYEIIRQRVAIGFKASKVNVENMEFVVITDAHRAFYAPIHSVGDHSEEGRVNILFNEPVELEMSYLKDIKWSSNNVRYTHLPVNKWN